MKVIAHANLIHAGAHVAPGQEFDWTGSDTELTGLIADGLVGAVVAGEDAPVAPPVNQDRVLITLLADALHHDGEPHLSYEAMIDIVKGYSDLVDGVLDAVEGVSDAVLFRDRVIDLVKHMTETLTAKVGQEFLLDFPLDVAGEAEATKAAADAKKAAEKEAADKARAEKAEAAKKAADAKKAAASSTGN